MKYFIPSVAMMALASLPASAQDEAPLTAANVMERAEPTDWQAFDPDNLLYMELEGGTVVIALSPEFTPGHTENVRKLASEGFYDGLHIYRVQENYVVQWGDFSGEKDVKTAKRSIPAEFETENAQNLPFTPLPGPDGYAAQTGFSGPFPAAKTEDGSLAWMPHCPGAVGMARDVAPDSGGTEIYAVIGQAPRHLDHNVTIFGRVISGMEHFSTLPRGHEALGFFADEAKWTPIKSIRLGSDLDASERTDFEYLRTDTALFQDLVTARSNRREEWFRYAAGHIDVCNMPVPIREVEKN